MALGQSSPHPSPLLAGATNAPSIAEFQAPAGISVKPAREPGHDPIPSGHILQGRRINRSVQRRPTVPKRHPRKRPPRRGGVNIGFPTVPAPQHVSTKSVQASSLVHRLQKPQRSSGSVHLGSLKGYARPRFRRVEGYPDYPRRTAHSRPTTGFPQLCPLSKCPRSALHLVSAHPPCSRKGPHLPACGLKCPRRVKRETTNSRFCVFVDSDRIGCGATSPTQVGPSGL